MANLTPKCNNGWTNLPASRPTECATARKGINLAGIAEVRRLWGDEAAEAARQHIIANLKLEGWRETDPFPKDEQHYQRMGLF